MAYNNYAPFWDFVRGLDSEGAGVDHAPHPGFPGPPPPPHHLGGFPFGGPLGGSPMFAGFPHPHPQPHLHPHHPPGPAGDAYHNECGPGECQPGTADANISESPWPEGERRSQRCPRGPHGRGRHHGPRGSRPPPPFGSHFGPIGGFDMNAFLGSLSTHPLAQAFRSWAEQAAAGYRENPDTGNQDSENAFVPPVDIFSTETQYVLHVAIPGAKKEDVGVNWDPEKAELNLAGVVYRQGDEEFLKTLTKSERRVGVFERSVKLPPGSGEDKVEIDSDAISAKLEDGVLVVIVPKVEKGWTEVKRVDIE